MPEENQSDWGKYLGYGMQMAVGAGLGALAGYWLDRKLGWTPWGMIVCIMLGVASGIYLLIKDALQMNKD